MWGALYPGQGSQHVGMGKFLFENFKPVKELFEEASDTLSLNFKKLCFDGPESDLTLTQNTQPALLLVSVATYKTVCENTDIQFSMAAGHSIGEYAALVNAQSLDFKIALTAVRKRGQYMQQAVPVGEGGMVAVLGLDAQNVQRLCQWACETSGLSPLEPANFNSPEQTVISGSAQLTQWTCENLDKSIFKPEPRRLKLIPLKVSAPFHCTMMKPAEDNMRQELESIKFKAAKYPVIQNFTGKTSSAAKELRENLIRQISAPVRWVECMEEFKKQGVTQFVELGAGKVLAGLSKKVDKESFKTFNINSIEDLKALEAL